MIPNYYSPEDIKKMREALECIFKSIPCDPNGIPLPPTDNTMYVMLNGNWVRLTPEMNEVFHNLLKGLQGGDKERSEYYHLSERELSALRALMADVDHPTYTQPKLIITPTDVAVEYGTELIDQSIILTYTKNDAGDGETYKLTKKVGNGEWIDVGSDATEYIIPSLTINAITMYRGTVFYPEGACKQNAIGEIDCTGRIVSGSKTADLVFTPYNRLFFGNYGNGTAPTLSNEIRALYAQELDKGGNYKFTVTVNNVDLDFYLAIPQERTILDVFSHEINSSVKSAYRSVGTISVNDAGGNAKIYKLYHFGLSAPLSLPHVHDITIKNA